MGLSAPKKRIKLSHDPNNTAWSNDTQSFGLKMMTAQGWTPGSLLGAKDAPHAEFHTAANASHIRVTIKDDNLGLGAKIGSGVGHGECTGLDAFTNILGRLNGKDDKELVMEQKKRDDLRRAIYTEKKWGSRRFVSGGFLVGDKIQDLIDGEAKRLRKIEGSSLTGDSESSSESGEEAAPVERPKKSKKRKAEAIREHPEVMTIKTKKSKKKQKLKAISESTQEITVEIKKAKKSKERRSTEDTHDTSEDLKSRKRKKEGKKRLGKRNDKDHEKEMTEKDESKSEDLTQASKKKSKQEKQKPFHNATSEPSIPSTKESSPTMPITNSLSGRSTPMMQGRHAVRSRNIAQKRLAHMDVAALNQIFMIKS